ncbi:hypothetical protein J6590_040804 [Homalodisca vitripennis]|nr:hypothetical protein J6590_040804 [Homalodisca vitripennis]
MDKLNRMKCRQETGSEAGASAVSDWIRTKATINAVDNSFVQILAVYDYGGAAVTTIPK